MISPDVERGKGPAGRSWETRSVSVQVSRIAEVRYGQPWLTTPRGKLSVFVALRLAEIRLDSPDMPERTR